MANQLKMAMIDTIVTLLERGWSYRRIARELGIHRETVARHDRLRREEAAAKPAIPTPGSDPPRRPAGRQSHCVPFRERIQASLDRGLTAQRIFQDLRAESAFAGSYASVKRFVRSLTAATPLPFRRMECAPGEEAQVDFRRRTVGDRGRTQAPHSHLSHHGYRGSVQMVDRIVVR